jgi:hypothetical protein
MDGGWLGLKVSAMLSGSVQGKGDEPDKDIHFSLLAPLR